MGDRVFLRDYRREIEIGAFAEERAQNQTVRFSVELALDQPRPKSDDDVDEILSYDVIIAAIEQVLARQRFNLLEYLADQIATALFVYSQVASVHLTIEKLDRVAGSLGVAITRDRAEMVTTEASDTPKVDLHFVAANDVVVAALELNKNAVIVPLIDAVITPGVDARLHVLALDQWAWRLGAATDRPVVDSQTEAEALTARGQGFVRAFGKAPFADPEFLARPSPRRLAELAIMMLGAHTLTWHDLDSVKFNLSTLPKDDALN